MKKSYFSFYKLGKLQIKLFSLSFAIRNIAKLFNPFSVSFLSRPRCIMYYISIIIRQRLEQMSSWYLPQSTYDGCSADTKFWRSGESNIIKVWIGFHDCSSKMINDQYHTPFIIFLNVRSVNRLLKKELMVQYDFFRFRTKHEKNALTNEKKKLIRSVDEQFT